MLSGTDGSGRKVVTMTTQELMVLAVQGLDLRSEGVPVSAVLAYATWRAAFGSAAMPPGSYATGSVGDNWTFTYGL